MPTAVYLCPYDQVARVGRPPFRRCALARHIPVVPNALGAKWEEIELLGSYCLVKVVAPSSLHVVIEADPDIRRIPLVDGAVPVAARGPLRARLLGLGFTNQQLDGTGWRLTNLANLLSDEVDDLRLNAGRTGFVRAGRRSPGRRWYTVERDLPDD